MMESKRKLNSLVENSNTCLNLQVLTNSKDKTRRERILRNHMASHVIAAWEGRWKGSEIAHDPCMYCCSSMRMTGCTVEIVGSKVKPECKFQHVPEFPQKSLKSSKNFPTTNQPMRCERCSSAGPKPKEVFIPKYNMLSHYKEVHGIDYDEEHCDNLHKYVIGEDEKKKVTDNFEVRESE